LEIYPFKVLLGMLNLLPLAQRPPNQFKPSAVLIWVVEQIGIKPAADRNDRFDFFALGRCFDGDCIAPNPAKDR
jgi:hypothetical protein